MNKKLSVLFIFVSMSVNAFESNFNVDKFMAKRIGITLTAKQINEFEFFDQVVITKPYVKLSEFIRINDTDTNTIVFEANKETAQLACKAMGYGSYIPGTLMHPTVMQKVAGIIEAQNGALTISAGPQGREIQSLTCKIQ